MLEKVEQGDEQNCKSEHMFELPALKAMVPLDFSGYVLVCVCVCVRLSHAQLFATRWTVARQAPLSMEFSWQEYWSGLLCPSPGDLPNPGIEPGSPALQADAFLSELLGKLIS